MTTDTSWSAMADLEPQAARAQMADRFRAIVKLPEAAQDEQLRGMITSEYELKGAPLHDFTMRRLRCWIDIGAEDARVAAAGYTRSFRTLPGDMAMRHILADQTAVRDMDPDEITALRAIIPDMVAELQPTRRPEPLATTVTKKPAWKFWQKN